MTTWTRLEKSLAKGEDAVPAGRKDEVCRYEQGRTEDKAHVEAKFRVFQDNAHASLAGSHIHAEIGARYNHKKARIPSMRGLLK